MRRRSGTARRHHARRAERVVRSEEGFTIIEMVVAISLLAIVLPVFAWTFRDTTSAASSARLREVAGTVADSALDNARAVVPATTLLAAGTVVTSPPAPVDLTSTVAPVALPPQQTTLNGHVYSATTYVGEC